MVARAPWTRNEEGAVALLERNQALNLRGRGGARLHHRLKWEACRNAPLQPGQRIVVCNADEGGRHLQGPGAAASYADLVFEGMTGAPTVSARRGFLYLRGEYRYLRSSMLSCSGDAVRDSGANIWAFPGPTSTSKSHVGAGAYVCSEESALIEIPGRQAREPLATARLSR